MTKKAKTFSRQDGLEHISAKEHTKEQLNFFRHLWSDRSLSAETRIVGCWIADSINAFTQEWSMGIDTLMRLTGFARGTVVKAIKELEAKYINVLRQHRRNHTYSLQELPAWVRPPNPKKKLLESTACTQLSSPHGLKDHLLSPPHGHLPSTYLPSKDYRCPVEDDGQLVQPSQERKAKGSPQAGSPLPPSQPSGEAPPQAGYRAEPGGLGTLPREGSPPAAPLHAAEPPSLPSSPRGSGGLGRMVFRARLMSGGESSGPPASVQSILNELHRGHAAGWITEADYEQLVANAWPAGATLQ